MTGLAIYIGATQIGESKQTAGSLSRWVTDIDWGDPTLTVFGHPSPMDKGFIRTGTAHAAARTVSFTIVSEYVGANAERFIHDEIWDDLPDLLSPGRGGVDLRVDRTDSAGGTTSRILTCDTVQLPDPYKIESYYVQGSEARAWAKTPVTLQANFPLWRDREEQAVDTVALATTPGTAIAPAYTNGGYVACGLRAVLSSIVGVWTSISISMTEAATAVTWTDATFANSDALDFWVTDPQAVTWSSGTAINAAGDAALARGTNNGTIIGVGGTSGTVTLTTRRFWKGP